MELLVVKIRSRIYDIRGLKIMLDFDLAEMYEVETKDSTKLLKEI